VQEEPGSSNVYFQITFKKEYCIRWQQLLLLPQCLKLAAIYMDPTTSHAGERGRKVRGEKITPSVPYYKSFQESWKVKPF